MIHVRVATAALRHVRRMEEMAELARQRARQLGRPVLVSVSAPVSPDDPLALFARAVGATHNRFFWSQPSQGLAVTGLGAAWEIAASGEGRFVSAAAAWRDLVAHACIDADPNLPFAGPVAAAGFAFDPLRPTSGLWADFPDGLLFLPRMILARQGDLASLTFNGLVGPETSSVNLYLSAARRLRDLLGGPWRAAHPAEALPVEEALPASTWRTIVAEAVADLRAAKMEKVVLAREVRLQSEQDFDIPAALERLRNEYPDTFVFAVAHGGRAFLGASPERLVSLRGGVVAASGLAGSMARGATPEDDDRLGAALLNSEKDRREHALVVTMIRSALGNVCSHVEAPSEPVLMKVRNIQHLFTPVTGRIAGGRSVLDLVAALHPTPAVGGKPNDVALEWIRANERLDRGWYAGPVGWLDARGEGEFAVALRSALVSKREAALFAGCGIVSGSDPAREEQESQLKLRPMLSALGGGA
ncbi:isochorismate synthase [Candidatus Oscillochloris fontis]|uniref:isochorismate synthase n=1 Tax=Candidatus Oscillochloris fontis TaxID=2496868 RepID=UPI00101D86F6|nr:isochorismate synthase [Candidatus Oscillochloris fontis]